MHAAMVLTLIADLSAAAAVAPVSIEEPALSGRIIQIFLLVTTLSLAPGIAMMATSLPLIVIVLSILRQGGGLQQSPPNMMIMGLAIFLTWLIMEPVFGAAWSTGVQPFLAGTIKEDDAIGKIIAPFSDFMISRVDRADLQILSDARGLSVDAAATTPSLSLLAPAFVLSEIQKAFEIGFVILLPFLIIDLLVASILMAMGMMMVPPAIVSLPFKLSFFVLTNGWVAISGALVRSYS